MPSKQDLVITALQQRIGEITAEYEIKIAFLRAELTSLVDSEKEKQKAIDEYSESINNLIGGNDG